MKAAARGPATAAIYGKASHGRSSAGQGAGDSLVAEGITPRMAQRRQQGSSDRGLGDACMWQGAVEHGSPSLCYRVSALGA
jgi:hypothetical protein